MLFNKDVLFIHTPKTGGTSMKITIQKGMEPPVYAYEQWHENKLEDVPVPRPEKGKKSLFDQYRSDLHFINGQKHNSIDQGIECMTRLGFDVFALKAIIVTVRNPYDMVASLHAFLFNHYKYPKKVTFRDFICCPESELTNHQKNMQRYYTTACAALRDKIKIVRFENMDAELNEILHSAGLPGGDIPKVNVGNHKHWRELVTTPEIESAIYRQYQWIFDAGFYERITGDEQ